MLLAALLLAGCGGGGSASGGGNTASASATTAEDTAVTFDPVVNDPDPGDTHVLTVVTPPAHGTAQVVSNRFVYTPEADYNGGDSFTFLATDSAGNAFAGTATVTVTPVNDPPSAVSAAVVTDEDVEGFADPAVSDPDAGDTHTFTIVSQPANGTAGTSSGLLTYMPAADFNGTDSFTFAATDSGGAVKTGTATVTVNPVNDAPTSATASATTAVNTATDVVPVIADPDAGDTFTLAIVVLPTNGTAVPSGDRFTYTAGGTPGADTFTFTATDSGGLSVTGTATVNVTAANQAPTSTSASLTTDEDTQGFADPSVTDPDPGDTHTFSIVLGGEPAHGTASVVGNRLAYTPDPDYDGGDLFTFRATDSGGASVDGTCAVTVNPVNDPPTSASATIVINEDTPALVAPTVADPDPGDSFTLSIVSQASNGTAGVSGGQLTYIPNANFNGSDGFTFKATDSGGLFVTGTAAVTVNPVNDTPAVADLAVTGLQDTALTSILPVITDPDSTGHTLAVASPPVNGGSAVVNGSFVTYTPSAGFYGVDSFTVTATDDGSPPATSAPATVTVRVTGSFTTGAAPVDVAFGDFDGDGDPDVAVANAEGDAQNEVVSLFMNDGTGHLNLPRIALAPTGTGGAALGANALAVADLDGDGADDLVIVYGENDSFAVAMGNATPANITTSDPVDLSGILGSGAFLHSAALGNLDAGTVPDLAVASITADAVVILTGDGDGTFTYATTLSVGTNTSPFDVAIGDFNGDGNGDVAVVGLQPNANNLRWVSVFRGDGSGSGFTLANGDESTLATQGDADLAVADLDGDGKDDAVRTLRAEGQAAVLPGNAAGTLTTHTTYDVVATTAGNPAGVALADVDGDGGLDLVTANAGGDAVAVLPGAAGGTFGAARLEPAFPAPAALAAGLLNAGVQADTATVHPADDRLGLTLR